MSWSAAVLKYDEKAGLVLREITGWCVDQLQSTRAETLRVNAQTTLFKKVGGGDGGGQYGESLPKMKNIHEKSGILRALKRVKVSQSVQVVFSQNDAN